MASETFRYDLMVEKALRSVVREALEQAARTGLTGNHHFYVTFRTDFPGVEMPDYLREKYTHDITIVLEHKFWDLEVSETGFSVTLSFNKVPEHLRVPFDALLSFADPSVNFVLQFNVEGDGQAVEDAEEAPAKAPEEAAPELAASPGGEVITLDAFRKK